MKKKLLIRETVCPVIGVEDQHGRSKLTKVYGTAFPLGDSLFVTAGHSLKGVLEAPRPAIGFVEADSDKYRILDIVDHHIAESLDIAFAKVRNMPAEASPASWQFDDLFALSDVWTTGYPMAWDLDSGELAARSFKGHLVGGSVSWTIPAHPHVYELSFQAPCGLSGAPLRLAGDDHSVVGVIVGNASAEMEVFRDSEHEIESNKETVYIRVEAMQFGVAIPSHAIQTLECDLLGGSLGDFLRQRNLVAE